MGDLLTYLPDSVDDVPPRSVVDDPVDPQASEAAAADGLPVWVAPVLVAGLLLIGGAVAGVRRFRGAPGRP